MLKAKTPGLSGVFNAGQTGLEPATSGVTGRCSNQLNYCSVSHFSMIVRLSTLPMGTPGCSNQLNDIFKSRHYSFKINIDTSNLPEQLPIAIYIAIHWRKYLLVIFCNSLFSDPVIIDEWVFVQHLLTIIPRYKNGSINIPVSLAV